MSLGIISQAWINLRSELVAIRREIDPNWDLASDNSNNEITLPDFDQLMTIFSLLGSDHSRIPPLVVKYVRSILLLDERDRDNQRLSQQLKEIDYKNRVLLLEKIQSEQDLEKYLKLSTTDFLTWLPNRSWFFAQQALITNNSARKWAWILFAKIDLVAFKAINDKVSEWAWDLAIKQYWKLLQSFRDWISAKFWLKVSISRYGWDEFAFIIEGFDGTVESLNELMNFFVSDYSQFQLPLFTEAVNRILSAQIERSLLQSETKQKVFDIVNLQHTFNGIEDPKFLVFFELLSDYFKQLHAQDRGSVAPERVVNRSPVASSDGFSGKALTTQVRAWVHFIPNDQIPTSVDGWERLRHLADTSTWELKKDWDQFRVLLTMSWEKYYY